MSDALNDQRELWHNEAVAILDSLHDSFLYDKRSDRAIDAIEQADTRLRVLLRLLAGVE